MATALIVRLAYKDLPTGRGEKLGVLISVDKRSGLQVLSDMGGLKRRQQTAVNGTDQRRVDMLLRVYLSRP